MADDAGIRVDLSGGVAVVTIDRPERRNALSKDAWSTLRTEIGELRNDGDVVGLIVTGAGDRAFAAGADIEELADRPAMVALDGLVQRVLLDLEALPFPTITAINGHALGGGWELALACDLRVAVSSAKVGFPEVGLGILPGAGGIARLVRNVGVGLAKEWVLTGRLLDAAEAHAVGLVNRVVDPGEALVESRRLMDELARQPRTALRLAKLLIDAAGRGEANPEMERLAYALTFHAPDRAERMHAFLERREVGERDRGGG
jgi:enoyl-CoA hydratase/carnithine racemase